MDEVVLLSLRHCNFRRLDDSEEALLYTFSIKVI